MNRRPTLRRLALTVAVGILFQSALTPHSARGRTALPEGSDSLWPRSLEVTRLYTDALATELIRGDRTAAVDSLSRALRLDSTHAPSWFRLAVLRTDSLPEQALQDIQRALSLDSANVWYRRLYGRLAINLDRYDEAVAAYSRLLRDEPKNPENYRLLALLYNQLRQPYRAIILLDSAERRFGVDEQLSPLKRQLLMETGQYDKALDEARRLADSDPYNTSHEVVLAEMLASTGQDSLAQVHYRQALRLDSTDVGALLSLADFHNRRKEARSYLSVVRRLFQIDEVPLREKVRLFDQLTSDRRFYADHYALMNDLAQGLYIRYPQEWEAFSLYLGHLLASGEREAALGLMKTRLQTDSVNRFELLHTVIDLEGVLNRPDSVARYTALALHYDPHSPEFFLRRAGMLLYLDQPRQALRSVRQALRYAGSDTLRHAAYGQLGDICQRLGRPRAAIDAYERALQLDSTGIVVLNNYAYYLSELGIRLDRALRMSRYVMEAEGNNPTYIDTYAWILYRLGRYEEARRTMQQAVSLDRSENADLLFHYAEILRALGEEFMARTYYERAERAGYGDLETLHDRLEQLRPKR